MVVVLLRQDTTRDLDCFANELIVTPPLNGQKEVLSNDIVEI